MAVTNLDNLADMVTNSTSRLEIRHDCQGSQTQEESVSETELYIVIVLLSIMSVVGSAGNILVMYVFSKKRDKQVSTLFILVMAFVDGTTCLFVIPYTIYMEYIEFNIKYDVLCKLYQFLITSNIPFSALIMAAIAIDRYLCICHPFLRALTVPRAKIVTAGLALLSVGLGVIVALMYSVYHLPAPACGNEKHQSATIILNSSYFHTEHASMGSDTATQVYTKTYEPNSDHTYRVLRNTTQPASNPASTQQQGDKYVYTGYCGYNERILTETFQWYYQKFYISMYVLCLGIVIVLYCLIYRSVLKRRSKREKQKSKALPLIQSAETITKSSPATLLTVVNGNVNNGDSPPSSVISDTVPLKTETEANGNRHKKKKPKSSSIKKVHKQKTAKKDKTRMANIKTALMLFVVTLVFIVTFAPAFLMSLAFLPYNIVIFYMYFANNVANPVIYSFMNKNFRDDLRKLFCRNR